MFDNGRVWAPRPQTLPVKPAHALLSKGPKQGVEIALKVREKKPTHAHTHTETNTHRHTKTCTWTQTSNPPSGCCVLGKGGEPLRHQAANHTCPCSESKVVQHSRHQTVLKLSYLCHRMEVALYLRNSQCHYAVTVSFISPPRFTFIYLSLCLSFCTVANGGHVYSTMRIWCFIKKKKKKKKEAKSWSVVSCDGDWNAKNDLRTCSKGLTRQLFLKILQLEDFKKLSLANRDVINSGRPGIGKIKGLHSSRFPLSCRLPFPQAWLNLNGIWI